MIDTVYTVSGMNCVNCASAVTKALSGLTDVDKATVDLSSGRATVISALPLDEDEVRKALEDAGYALRA
jgi:copper chaperone